MINKKERIMVSVGAQGGVGIWWAFLYAITLKQIGSDSFPTTDTMHGNISSQTLLETVFFNYMFARKHELVPASYILTTACVFQGQGTTCRT